MKRSSRSPAAGSRYRLVAVLARLVLVGVGAMTVIALIGRTLLWAGMDGLAASLSGRATVNDVVGAGAAGVGLVCLGWIVVAIAAEFVSRVPGRIGHLGAGIAERVTPTFIRPALAAALGVGLAGVSMSPALAATPADSLGSSVGALAYGLTTPASDVWPPLLDRPGASPRPTEVIVRPGDCLWSIAADYLGADASAGQIDSEWRRWYATNRAVVGPDPNLIHPGQRLISPP